MNTDVFQQDDVFEQEQNLCRWDALMHGIFRVPHDRCLCHVCCASLLLQQIHAASVEEPLLA